MSGGLAPSKSTVYVGNLPYYLTNNDLHKIFEKYGKVVKVTILKNKETRKSKGVAFVLYLERQSAHRCVRALDKQELFGRTLKCRVATDNGRAAEFIRRRVYKDKSRCYECGDVGHLSYVCPQNSLGDREPPKKKEKKEKKKKWFAETKEEDEEETHDSDEDEDPALESLSEAIRYQQEKIEEEEYMFKVATGRYDEQCSDVPTKCKKITKSSYFSDEEEIDDDN